MSKMSTVYIIILAIISAVIMSTLFGKVICAQEHKLVCNQITGCPIINGACPSCIMKEDKEEFLDNKINRMLIEWEEEIKIRYSPNLSKRYKKPSGWGVIDWKINEALYVRKDFNLF